MRPVDRSMNRDLTQGMVDGKLNSAYPDRGGLPEAATPLHRTRLDFNSFGDSAGEVCSEVNPSDERPDIVGLLP